MEFFGKRASDAFLIELMLSLIFSSVINIETIKSSFGTESLLTLCSLIINIIFHICFLKNHLYAVESLKEYFITNIAVFICFFAFSVVMAAFCPEPLYSYMLLPYKTGMCLEMSKLRSSVSINLIMWVITLVIPFFG